MSVARTSCFWRCLLVADALRRQRFLLVLTGLENYPVLKGVKKRRALKGAPFP
jgi:hypothetical protein